MENTNEIPVVLLSLHKQWWNKMLSGEKVLEIRKTQPKCSWPFKVIVYVTGGVGVVGEFICPEVMPIRNYEEAAKQSKVPAHEIHNYAAGSRNTVCGWRIVAPREYTVPHSLEEYGIKRAPQSWQYINR